MNKLRSFLNRESLGIANKYNLNTNTEVYSLDFVAIKSLLLQA